VKEIAWCTEVIFEKRVARRFGSKRSWLAGDAAHQTGPAGVQSMNSGFAEGETLARLVKETVRNAAPLATLGAYEDAFRPLWRKLIGLEGEMKAQPAADQLLAEHRARLLSCVPSADDTLPLLAGQLGLQLV
jgi:2-polyprenyl-6-methoxyphenol hydroxylase-like FAD-dependent oxidoreductase